MGFLGASWEPLGASWGLLGRSSDFSPNFYRFWLPKRTQKGAKGEPKWHQKGTQYGQKSKTKCDKKRNLSELVLDTLLGSSWVCLGPTWTSKSCCGPRGARFFEKSFFVKNRSWKPILDRTWANLGAQECPNGPPRGIKNEPKSDQKRSKKKLKK